MKAFTGTNDVPYTNPLLLKAVVFDLAPPLNPYRQGYGPKVPSNYRVIYGETAHETMTWRRVYAARYSNSVSLWIEFRCRKLFLDSFTEHVISNGYLFRPILCTDCIHEHTMQHGFCFCGCTYPEAVEFFS